MVDNSTAKNRAPWFPDAEKKSVHNCVSKYYKVLPSPEQEGLSNIIETNILLSYTDSQK